MTNSRLSQLDPRFRSTLGKHCSALMFACLFVINLTIGRGEASCITPKSSDAGAPSAVAIASEPMAEMDMGSSASGSDESPSQEPCDQSVVPVQCVAAAGCTSAPLGISFNDTVELDRNPTVVTVLEVLPPTSLHAGPDTPPPRV